MEQKAVTQVVIDLPDFIPEQYTMSFSICGRRYVVDYAEATVDEVLVMMAEAQVEDVKGQAIIEHRRRVVSSFLPSHLTEGDATQLVEDLKLLPYTSLRGSLDILSIYDQLTARYRKKDLGEWTPANPPSPRPSGLLGRLRWFFGKAKAD